MSHRYIELLCVTSLLQVANFFFRVVLATGQLEQCLQDGQTEQIPFLSALYLPRE